MVKRLVLGLGNPLRGDDGVGPAVISQLTEAALPPDVSVVDGGTPGLETVLLLEGYEQAILVDAADMGLAPGTWRRISPDMSALKRRAGSLTGTLHDAGVAEALILGQALGVLPDKLIIYGVQPEHTDWVDRLSEPVEAVVPAICAAIVEEISTPA